MALTQDEFNFLIQQSKEFEDLSQSVILGPAPLNWTRKINSTDTRESFLLDFYRGALKFQSTLLIKDIDKQSSYFVMTMEADTQTQTDNYLKDRMFTYIANTMMINLLFRFLKLV